MKTHLIWSHEHSAWWRPNAMGYTYDVSRAGAYTAEEARRVTESATHDWSRAPNEVPVLIADLPASVIERIMDNE